MTTTPNRKYITLYRKYINQAEKLNDKELALHAAVGKICKCNNCFCCAAEYERYAREKNASDLKRFLKDS